MDEAGDRNVGRRIAAARAERGWSQQALARLAGMTQPVLSRIEAGKRRLTVNELDALARALGVEPAALLGGGPEGAAAEPADAAEAPELTAPPWPAAGAEAPPTVRAAAREAYEAPPDVHAGRALRDEWRLADAGERARLREREFLEDEETVPESPAPNALEADLRSDLAARSEYRLVPSRTGPSHGRWPFLSRPMRLEDLRRLRAGEPFAALEKNAREELRAAVPTTPAPGAGPTGPEAADAARAAAERAARHLSRLALPGPVAAVVVDYVRLRALAGDAVPAAPRWSAVDAYGRRRPGGKLAAAAGRGRLAISWHEPRDRYARLWRHELGVDVESPLPDPVTLLEDAGAAEVVVAALGDGRPVCAALTLPGEPGGASGEAVSFVFVNAARPVVLQRHALAHAFAHLALGHDDVVDDRIAWSRSAPLEMEANDFAEEFLAPVAAVRRWYERHGEPAATMTVLLELAAAFGISPWSAFYRSLAAGAVTRAEAAALRDALVRDQWRLLPELAFRAGLRDTLSTLSEEVPLPPPGATGLGGVPAPHTRDPDVPAPARVLRVPGRMRAWALAALRRGLLHTADAARLLREDPASLSAALRRLGEG